MNFFKSYEMQTYQLTYLQTYQSTKLQLMKIVPKLKILKMLFRN